MVRGNVQAKMLLICITKRNVKNRIPSSAIGKVATKTFQTNTTLKDTLTHIEVKNLLSVTHVKQVLQTNKISNVICSLTTVKGLISVLCVNMIVQESQIWQNMSARNTVMWHHSHAKYVHRVSKINTLCRDTWNIMTNRNIRVTSVKKSSHLRRNLENMRKLI